METLTDLALLKAPLLTVLRIDFYGPQLLVIATVAGSDKRP